MRVTTLLIHLLVALVALVAPALSCPPPPNNFAFIGNETYTSTQLIEPALTQQGGLDWTEIVSDFLNNPVKAWPRNSCDYTHTFASEDTKIKLSNWISQARALCITKIGVPGKESNHGLRFQNHEKEGSPPYCRKDYGTWNDVHPRGSVVIDTMCGEGEGDSALAYASYGYRPKELDDTVLIRWKEAGPHPEGRKQDNCEIYGPNRTPSNGDYGSVRNVYTWQGP